MVQLKEMGFGDVIGSIMEVLSPSEELDIMKLFTTR